MTFDWYITVLYISVAIIASAVATFILARKSYTNNAYESILATLTWCLLLGLIIGWLWPLSLVWAVYYIVAWLGYKTQ